MNEEISAFRTPHSAFSLLTDHHELNPMPTRRQFLANCSAVALTASMSPVALAGLPSVGDVPLDRIGLTDFTRQLNTVFRVQLDNRSATELLLVDVRPSLAPQLASPYAGDAGNEKFTLLFRGSLAQPLLQDTHRFEHSAVGRFAMFIAPIGCMDPTQCYYEAVFNRPPGGGAQRLQPGARARGVTGPQAR